MMALSIGSFSFYFSARILSSLSLAANFWALVCFNCLSLKNCVTVNLVVTKMFVSASNPNRPIIDDPI